MHPREENPISLDRWNVVRYVFMRIIAVCWMFLEERSWKYPTNETRGRYIYIFSGIYLLRRRERHVGIKSNAIFDSVNCERIASRVQSCLGEILIFHGSPLKDLRRIVAMKLAWPSIIPRSVNTVVSIISELGIQLNIPCWCNYGIVCQPLHNRWFGYA